MFREGVEIKDYTLKRFLGRGGFGEVWLAEKKIEIADKRVPFALKFLSGDDRKLSDYASVRREINTWIDASGHKNIVSVLDGFTFENRFVIVSEYANGGSLREWLRENGGRSPSLEKTVEMMGGILDGLTHLHEQKIVHRDLKPENVLLRGDVPCIADFGVSRMVETGTLSSAQLGTNTAGSPLYMSPESFERTKPAPQIDIWSAGVMLFEMLSGKTPYAAETIPALIYEILTKEPRSLPANIPVTFQKVAKKALAKEIPERFATAREMREALLKALYLQDYTSTVAEEDFNATKLRDENRVEAAKTLSISNEKPKGDFVRNSKTAGRKKLLPWIGLGAGTVVAASIGFIAVTQFSNEADSNQKNTSVSNRTINTNSASNSNSGAENTQAAANFESGVKPAADKPDAAEKKLQPPPRPPVVKTETAPRKETPKPTPKGKKKVTLDELLKENQ